MGHLTDNNIGYWRHLFRAWRWAGILLVHGVMPDVWKTRVSDEICNHSDATRKYLLQRQYGIKS